MNRIKPFLSVTALVMTAGLLTACGGGPEIDTSSRADMEDSIRAILEENEISQAEFNETFQLVAFEGKSLMAFANEMGENPQEAEQAALERVDGMTWDDLQAAAEEYED